MANQQSVSDFYKMNIGCYLDTKMDRTTDDDGWIREGMGNNTSDIIKLYIEFQKMKALDQIAEHLDNIEFLIHNYIKENSDSFWSQNEAPPEVTRGDYY